MFLRPLRQCRQPGEEQSLKLAMVTLQKQPGWQSSACFNLFPCPICWQVPSNAGGSLNQHLRLLALNWNVYRLQMLTKFLYSLCDCDGLSAHLV